MINIGILLDVCGITYSETQLLKLETLVNNLIKKLLEKNSSHIDHFTTCDDPVKEEFFDENILEIKDDPLVEPKENPLEIKDDISKGQLISKCPFGVFKSPKETNEKISRISALASKIKKVV